MAHLIFFQIQKWGGGLKGERIDCHVVGQGLCLSITQRQDPTMLTPPMSCLARIQLVLARALQNIAYYAHSTLGITISPLLYFYG